MIKRIYISSDYWFGIVYKYNDIFEFSVISLFSNFYEVWQGYLTDDVESEMHAVNLSDKFDYCLDAFKYCTDYLKDPDAIYFGMIFSDDSVRDSSICHDFRSYLQSVKEVLNK